MSKRLLNSRTQSSTVGPKLNEIFTVTSDGDLDCDQCARVGLQLRLTRQRSWREAIRRSPALSAWPFVVVILAQMAVGGFSVYTLSAIRAYVTGESLWSKGQHEAVYFLDLYLDTGERRYLESFDRAIAVPLGYRKGRQFLESIPPNPTAGGGAFIEAGHPAGDIPMVVWMFKYFRGFPQFEEAISRWKEADKFILELDRLGKSARIAQPNRTAADFKMDLQRIDAEITPRAVAFSLALGDGARVVEWLLMLANFALAAGLAALTIWRVGKFLRHRRQIEGRLYWQASHDELTGLVNRRGFEERLSQMTEPAQGRPAGPCALMFIDLDQFKIVNDTCGHAAGDALLRRICPQLQESLGRDDLLARLGGDEFGIILPATDMPRALAVAEHLRAAVEGVDFVWTGRAFGVTASIGLVHSEAGDNSPDDMMRAADMACFMAKEKGRNRVHAHRGEDEETIGRVREMNWVQRIHQALNEDRFCLFAQEIVALSDSDTASIHIEVLLRLRDESGILIPPSSFLPAAERFGLMKLIDRWVVRHTFQTLAERRALPYAAPISRCGINLSGATIGDGAFLDFLKEAFADFAVSPHTICFEVTETTAIVNLEAARSFIKDLKALGCTFALDDFGSGMSSFNYLKELPVDVLKIDGGFVKNLLIDRADRAMVEMINHVAHVMGKRTVAEFVETAEVASVLRGIGIDYGQGYGIAAPKPFHARFEGVSAALLGSGDQYERLIA